MVFLTKDDLIKQILPEELDEITRLDDTIVPMSCSVAESEAITYLWDSYNTDVIFSKTEDDIHQLLVNIVSGIAICIIISRGQAGQNIEDRKNRYKRAVKWLEKAQKS